MNLAIPRQLDWAAKYRGPLEPAFAARVESQSHTIAFARQLRQLLNHERAIYDPARLAELASTANESFDGFLKAIQWHCLVQKFAKLQTSYGYRRLIDDESVNLRFEKLLFMSDDEITTWVDHLRHRMVELWDAHGTPPLRAFDPVRTARQFHLLSSAKPTSLRDDRGSLVLVDDTKLVSSIQSFFPALSKTRINHDGFRDAEGNLIGYSLYDLLASPSRRSAFQLGCRRQFQRDSMKSFSWRIDPLCPYRLGAENGAKWVSLFAKSSMANRLGYWLCRAAPNPARESSGYIKVDTSDCLSLNKAELLALHASGTIPNHALVNLVPSLSSLERHLQDGIRYLIRVYEKSAKLFPKALRVLQIAYEQKPSNFSPVIAKNLYERYTEHVKHQPVLNVYDTSAGWGGRIAGAMAVAQDRHIHYVGTDPNTRNVLPDSDITCYENLARFVNYSLEFGGDSVGRNFKPHTFEIFRVGSEVIANEEQFRQYKGKLDLVLSSPPYFSREIYSEDDTQSCNKFPTYEEWREGFLRPTLVTAYTYLRSERYLLWNVSDIRLGDTIGPIEQDSINILESLGAKLVAVEHMALTNMPGSDRLDENGLPTALNYVTVGGKIRKSEPIYVFWKP